MNVVETWLNTCCVAGEAHERCNERPSPTFIPHRLLKLEITSGPDLVFRLVHRHQVEPGTPYATLTHGFKAGHTGLLLTTSNLGDLTRPQNLSALPLTFRETFAVIRRLGLAHLWIDHLCITHDAPDEHVDNAEDVFRNAFVSIAALGAAAPSSGLFFARDPALVSPTVINFPVDAHRTTVPYHSVLELPHSWSHTYGDDPLSKSAHALKDRLLTPRVVHFGSKMVFWECYAEACAEVLPYGVESALQLDEDIRRFHFMSTPTEVLETTEQTMPSQRLWKPLLELHHLWAWESRIDRAFTEWFSLVELHSGCFPMDPKQRLLFVSGPARHMQQELKSCGYEGSLTFLAGMWKAMLPGGLLWNVREHVLLASNDTSPTPTWSWVSANGRVNFHHRTSKQAMEGLTCQLVEAETMLAADDGTAGAVVGRIVLRGKLALGILDHSTGASSQQDTEGLIHKLVDLDSGSLLAQASEESSSEYRGEWWISFDSRGHKTAEILCFPTQTKMVDGIGRQITGLVLRRLPNDCFTRCGIWSILRGLERQDKDVFKHVPDRQVEIV